RAFEGLLIQAGRARYTFSWSDVARLVDGSGAEVDLTDLVRRAVDDPRQVNALYDGLMRIGITPASAPAPISGGTAPPPPGVGAWRVFGGEVPGDHDRTSFHTGLERK